MGTLKLCAVPASTGQALRGGLPTWSARRKFRMMPKHLNHQSRDKDMLGRLIFDILKNSRSKDDFCGMTNVQGGSEVGHFSTRKVANRVYQIDDSNFIVHARHGVFLANRFDSYLGLALLEYGEYGEYEHLFLDSLLSEGGVVYEIGANIGSHTIALAKAVGPTGQVVAVEAQPAVFNILCANLALNGLTNVVPISAGCGSVPGHMVCPRVDYKTAAAHNSGGVSLLASGDGIPVEIIRVDDVLLRGNCKPPSLMKIDVEGMEQEVVLGAKKTIDRYRPIIYLENDRVAKSQQLILEMRSINYRMWWHCPFLYNPENFFGNSRNIWPDVASFNMVCIPRECGNHPATQGLPEVMDETVHPLMRNGSVG